MALLLNEFAESHLRKNKERSVHSKHLCSQTFTNMYEKFIEFSEKCSEASEIIDYLGGIVRLWKLMKNIMAAERTGYWRGHFHSALDLILFFR